MEKFLVKNISGTMFRFGRIKMNLIPNQIIDLVPLMNDRVINIKYDPDVVREISYNHLLVVEEVIDEPQTKELDNKLNEILNFLKNMPVGTLANMLPEVNMCQDQLKQMENEKKGEDPEKKSEDKMREEALMELLAKGGKDAKKNIGSLGQSKKIDKTDDFSDLI